MTEKKGIKNNVQFNESLDANDDFLQELREKLPQFFNDDGFDTRKFEDAIRKNNPNELSSGYRLDFIGKDYAKRQVGERPTSVIIPDQSHNEKIENSDSKNLFLTGDNLEVLRHLRQNYANSVDFIYIDPPYNTGSDGFVYPDSFQITDDMLAEFGIDSTNAKEVKEFKERYDQQGKKSHSAWLTFIYPRLVLARKLLKDDGVIFISIDDNEQANLKLMLDDIFGESNFITDFIWEKTQHFGRQKVNSYNNADYILCYGKNLFNKGGLKEELVEFEKSEFEDAPLYNDSNKMNDLRFPAGTVKFNISDGEYSKTTDEKYELLNTVKVLDGKNENEFILRFKSRWTNSTVAKELDKGTSFWVKTQKFAIRAIYAEGKKAKESPRQIIFTNQSNPAKTTSRFGERVDVSENASNYLSKLMGGEFFSYPKPVSLIKYLISLYQTGGRYLDNIRILDFFAGSATTADAVMQLNKEDGGDRQYIMVQIPEQLTADSTAAKAGFNTIDEISRARIEKAAGKIGDSSGYKHYTVKEIQADTLDKLERFDSEVILTDDMISDIPGGVDTLLTTWMTADGYKFDEPVEKKTFGHGSGYYVAESILYIFENTWDSEATKQLLNELGKHSFNLNTIIVSEYALTFESMTELKTNIKVLKDKDFDIQVEVRN